MERNWVGVPGQMRVRIFPLLIVFAVKVAYKGTIFPLYREFK